MKSVRNSNFKICPWWWLRQRSQPVLAVFFEGKIVETLRCASCERSDHKNVIFKKIEG